MITCGQDGDIRIWDGIEDGDPIEKCVGSEAFAVHQSVISINYIFPLFLSNIFHPNYF